MAQQGGLTAFLSELNAAFAQGTEEARTRAEFRARWRAVRIRTSGWDKERAELKDRYERINALHETSPYADPEVADQLVISCVQEIMESIGGELPPRPILDCIISSARKLLKNEVFFAFPNIDWNVPLSLDEGVALRRYLDRKERFLSRSVETISSWSRTFVNMWAGLLSYLPETSLQISDDSSSALTLSAGVADLMSDTNEAIERILLTLADEDLAHPQLFTALRAQLEQNLYRASGIHPDDAASSKRPLVLPTKSPLSGPMLAQAYLGQTSFKRLFDTELPISIPEPVRFEHCHIVGGTGHGKTQLLQLLIHQDIQEAHRDGRSVVVIDSQGDLIRTISQLSYFDPAVEHSLADRFMLIDPNDIAFPVSLNMFDANLQRINTYPALEREKILNGTIELYEYIFGALLGAELTQKQGLIFRYLARLMMVIPGANIHTLRELLEDGAKFSGHFATLEGTARQFFETEFMRPQFQATKTQALRRLWGVLSNPTFERMFSHTRNKVDLFDAMNSGKIIFINTAKDLLKQEGCEIFGRFFIAMIAQAALQRAAIPEHQRRDAFVYVDEAHDYFDDTIEQLLNQARKYRVGLTLSHQNLDQLSQGLRASIMASTSTKLVGGMSAKDAKTFAPDMRTSPEFLQAMHKADDRTQFACFVKNVTPRALAVSIPLGVVNALPTISVDAYDQLVAKNRELYCAPLTNIQTVHEKSEKAPTISEQDAPTPTEVGKSETKIPHVDHTADITAHRRIQNELKAAAQARGFSAAIEQCVLENTGSVDVAITHDNLSIACEISITTKPEHERHNVEKCLAAEFGEVWVIAPDHEHLGSLQEFIVPRLDQQVRFRIHFFAPEDALSRIDALASSKPVREDRVFGYDIKIEQEVLSETDRAARRRILAQLFSTKHARAEAST